VPHGHQGDELLVTGGHALGAGLGRDELLVIPAVGAEGRDTALRTFVDLLEP
jgi:hypothetical protein